MKIKLQPGGKLIVALFFLIIFYLLLSWTGIFGIFSSKEKKAVSIDSTKTAVRLPDRAIRIGFVTGNVPENINSANGGKVTTENSIFHKFGLKASLIECNNSEELAKQLKTGGDQGGVDIAYCNTIQLIKKADLFHASGAKCFLLSDITTEKDYIISNKEIKNISGLGNKRISLCEFNSSLPALMSLLKKNNANGIKIDFTASDKESLEKLAKNEVSAAIVKDKNISDYIKSNKNYKILTEVQVRKSNVLIAPSASYNNYFAYLKTVAKCCIMSSDSLKTIKGFYDNINFSDIKSNVAYLIDRDRAGKTGFVLETDDIITHSKGFISSPEKLNLSDFVYDKIVSELAQTKSISKINTVPVKTNIVTKDKISGVVKTNKTNASSHKNGNTIKTKKYSSHSKKHTNGSKPKKEDKPKSITGKQKEPTSTVKNKTQYDAVSGNPKIINFGPNSSEIDSMGEKKLSVVAKDIQNDKANRVILIGHTDSTGEEAYNLILSKKRAETVMEYLSKNFGIDKSIFKTSGKGSKEPLGKNSDKNWKKRNRRVNIIIKNK
jgi:outer membrane protein OmpA-like peptidoglycan-associated protein